LEPGVTLKNQNVEWLRWKHLVLQRPAK